MIIKNPHSFFKVFCTASILFLGISCTNNDSITELVEEQTIASKSSSSLELSISEVSASTFHSSYPAINVIDGNGTSDSRWSGYGTDVEFYVDLGSQDLIDYVLLDFAGGNTRVYTFEIYTSVDENSWDKVGSKKSSGDTTEFEEFDLVNSTARYMKFLFKGNSVSDWNNVSELQVYGFQGEEEVVSESSAIDVVDFGDLEVETSWLSEDTGDRDVFDAADVDGEEWMDVYNSGIVMMKCLASDSHRTELKEKPGIEASLNTYKMMNYTATLTSIPSHGVTIAQIHNRGGVQRPWIRVYVDEDRYIKIKQTLTTPWQTSNEGGSEYDTWVGPKYVSGDEFSVSVLIKDGEASFEIITNEEVYQETFIPGSDWGEYSEDYYLKAGVYTEGDDKEPQIKFSSFSLNY